MRPLSQSGPLLLLAALALPLVGCEGDAEPSVLPPRQIAAPTGDDPLSRIPLEELYGATPVQNLWSPQVEIEVLNLPPRWDGLRIAMVSDLLIGHWEGNAEVARAAIALAVESRPDLVALLGDYLVDMEQAGALAQALAPLRGQRTVAVLGGRDVRTDSLEARVVRTLEEAGIQVLRNHSVPMELRGDTGWVAGIDPDVLGMTFADQEWVVGRLGSPDRPGILLTNFPALSTRASAGRFPLILAGGTFCGGVEMPGTPRISWVRQEALPGAYMEGTERLFQVRGGTMVVTCGTGYGFVPVRFGAPAEVPVVTLRRVGARVEVAGAEEVPDTLIQRFQGPAAEPETAEEP
jgi:uncharacterized protein